MLLFRISYLFDYFLEDSLREVGFYREVLRTEPEDSRPDPTGDPLKFIQINDHLLFLLSLQSLPNHLLKLLLRLNLSEGPNEALSLVASSIASRRESRKARQTALLDDLLLVQYELAIDQLGLRGLPLFLYLLQVGALEPAYSALAAFSVILEDVQVVEGDLGREEENLRAISRDQEAIVCAFLRLD